MSKETHSSPLADMQLMAPFTTNWMFNPYAAGGLFGRYKMMQKPKKKKDMGTHLRKLSESFPMDTNMTGFRLFSKIFGSLCFGRK